VKERTLWCHAVSVGEVKAVKPMLVLLEEDTRTKGRVVLSTVTVTGQDTAQRECGFVRRIFYFPLDVPFVVDRAIRRVNPEIFITAETEIWPNFFSACFRRGVPVIVVNGRISDSSFPRYLRFRWFFRPIIERVSLYLMQSEEDARRILEMGARPGTVKVTGNMKYDRVPETVALPDAVRRWAKNGFLLVAGSTHEGEEEIVLDALGVRADNSILIALVPRHPERFDDVAGLLEKRAVPFTRYSEILKGKAIKDDILLVDAMGLLDGFYALADVAFVGGSLVPVGGHNLLEPAMHGIPVLTGPYTHNFKNITTALLEGDGCAVVYDPESINKSIQQLKNTGKREKMGRAAFMVSRETSGAVKKNTEIITRSLDHNLDVH
jgi:3-deoxy-D-manno-octulosonic-acid transferase